MALALPTTLDVAFFNNSPSIWSRLTPHQRSSCIGAPLNVQIESRHVWAVAGPLLACWNRTGYNEYIEYLDEMRRQASLFKPRRKIVFLQYLFLLSATDNWEDGEPHIVVAYKKKKRYGDQAIEYFLTLPRVRRHATPHLCRLYDISNTADSPLHSSMGKAKSRPDIIPTVRVRAYGGQHGKGEQTAATVCVVLAVAGRDFALTPAHIFARTRDTVQVLPDPASDKPSEVSTYDTDDSSDDATKQTPSQPQLYESYGIHIATAGSQGLHIKWNTKTTRVIVDFDLDWALIRLDDPGVPIGSWIHDLDIKSHLEEQGILNLSENPLPPQGRVRLMCGVTGGTYGHSLGMLSEIAALSSEKSLETYPVACQIAEGDSGALVFDDVTRDVYGMLVGYDRVLRIAHVAPIVNILSGICARCPGKIAIINPKILGQREPLKVELTRHDSAEAVALPEAPFTGSSKPGTFLTAFSEEIKRLTMHNVYSQRFINAAEVKTWMLSPGDAAGTPRGQLLLTEVYTGFAIPAIHWDQISDADECYLLVFGILLELREPRLLDALYKARIEDRCFPYTMKDLGTIDLEVDVDAHKFRAMFYAKQWKHCPVFLDGSDIPFVPQKMIWPIVKRQQRKSHAFADLWDISVPQEFVSDSMKGLPLAEPRRNRESKLTSTRALSDTGDTYIEDDREHELCHFVFRSFFEHQKSEFEALSMLAQSLDGNFMRLLGSYTIETAQKMTYNMLLERCDTDLYQYFSRTEAPVRRRDIDHFWQRIIDVCNTGQILLDSQSSSKKFKWRSVDYFLFTPTVIFVADQVFKLSGPAYSQPVNFDQSFDRVLGLYRDYAPPELCHIPRENPNEIDKPAVEAWCLGCLLSEIATWLVLGPAGLQQYRNTRSQLSRPPSEENEIYNRLTDLNLFHDQNGVLPQVRTWHTYLKEVSRRSDRLTIGILSVVDTLLLRTEASSRGTARMACREIEDVLSGVSSKLIGRASIMSEPFETASFPQAMTPPPSAPMADQSPLTSQPPATTRTQSTYPVRTPPTTTSWVDRTSRDDDFERQMVQYGYQPSHRHPGSYSNYLSLVEPVESPSLSLVPNDLSPSSRYPRSQTVKEARNAANRWRIGKRSSDADSWLATRLRNTGITFFVDNGSHMSTCWPQVIKVVEVLFEKVDGLVAGDVGLVVANGAVNVTTSVISKRSHIAQKLKSKTAMPTEGVRTDMTGILHSIRYTYEQRNSQNYREIFFVMTDGLWEASDTNEVLDMLTRPPGTVYEDSETYQGSSLSIHFVAFGSKQNALYEIRQLAESPYKARLRHFLDVEPASGNVYKMLLGNRPGSSDQTSQAQGPHGRIYESSPVPMSHPYYSFQISANPTTMPSSQGRHRRYESHPEEYRQDRYYS